MPNLSRLISVSALALVTGCTTAGPDFQRPAAPAASIVGNALRASRMSLAARRCSP